MPPLGNVCRSTELSSMGSFKGNHGYNASLDKARWRMSYYAPLVACRSSDGRRVLPQGAGSDGLLTRAVHLTTGGFT